MTDKPPLLSIVTVTKNNASGVALTGKSLGLQMDAPEFEWIVIDGASVDNTVERFEQSVVVNKTLVSEPDESLFDAMNKGLDRAKGRYVWFLNAGDCAADSFVLRDIAREIPKSVGADFIYADSREDGHLKSARDISKFAYGLVTHHQAMLYRRDTIGAMRYDLQYKIAADYEFTLRMIEKAERMHYFKRVICDFAAPGLSCVFADLARHENYCIRRDALAMNPIKNKLIFWFNRFCFDLKRNYPKLYWKLRVSLR